MLIRIKKAQVVLEMGLFGAIILFAFAALISYVQRMNDDQYLTMMNFRRTLKKAHDENAVVAHSTLENVRHVNMSSPLEGQRAMLSASNVVHWAVPFVGEKPNQSLYYRINDEEVKLKEDTEIEDIYFDFNTQTQKEFTKSELNNIIVTAHNVSIDEESVYTLVNEDKTPIKVISQNETTTRSRSWRTAFDSDYDLEQTEELK
jgi:hypothetical protein